jgi:hypothetical protein
MIFISDQDELVLGNSSPIMNPGADEGINTQILF